MTIPYRARVVSGRLLVDDSVVRFHLKDKVLDGVATHPDMARSLTVKNEFAVPVNIFLNNFCIPEKFDNLFLFGSL